MNTEINRDFYFFLIPSEEGCPIEFTITDLLDYNLDDDYDSKEDKLSIIDGLILDIQDYRKEIEKQGKNI